MKISVVMASHLGDYEGSASGRVQKFRRAVWSFLNQSYGPKELVVVADGCPHTIREILDIRKTMQSLDKDDRILVSGLLSKSDKRFSGHLRNQGIHWASGDVICYLDSDDMLGEHHLSTIAQHFNGHDWVFFNDSLWTSPGGATFETRTANLNEGGVGTSNIAHKKGLNVRWTDGYGHDYQFVQQLQKNYSSFKKIPGADYKVCHIPGKTDF